MKWGRTSFVSFCQRSQLYSEFQKEEALMPVWLQPPLYEQKLEVSFLQVEHGQQFSASEERDVPETVWEPRLYTKEHERDVSRKAQRLKNKSKGYKIHQPATLAIKHESGSAVSQEKVVPVNNWDIVVEFLECHFSVTITNKTFFSPCLDGSRNLSQGFLQTKSTTAAVESSVHLELSVCLEEN